MKANLGVSKSATQHLKIQLPNLTRSYPDLSKLLQYALVHFIAITQYLTNALRQRSQNDEIDVSDDVCRYSTFEIIYDRLVKSSPLVEGEEIAANSIPWTVSSFFGCF